MTGQNPLKKHYPSATCLHCGKNTDIQMSHDYRHIIANYKTMKESIKIEKLLRNKIHRMKNGEIQALHKLIKQMLDTMTPEQREKVTKLSQRSNDVIKHLWQEEMGK